MLQAKASLTRVNRSLKVKSREKTPLGHLSIPTTLWRRDIIQAIYSHRMMAADRKKMKWTINFSVLFTELERNKLF